MPADRNQYYVSLHETLWTITGPNQAFGAYLFRTQAIEQAENLARMNPPSEVFLQRINLMFPFERIYVHDPALAARLHLMPGRSSLVPASD